MSAARRCGPRRLAPRLPTPFPSLMIRIREAGASTVGGSSCFHAHYNLTAPQSGNSWNTRFRGSESEGSFSKRSHVATSIPRGAAGAAAVAAAAAAASHDRQMTGRTGAD